MSLSRRQLLLATGSTLLANRVAALGPQNSLRSVERMLPGIPTQDGAGVSLTRVVGQPALRNLDPFLLLDRIHSDQPGAYIAGFPDHPHRGFETVSVMLQGRMRHRDSRSNSGLISDAGAQWMTAGRGIVHSEMPEQTGGLLSGFQLWVNLPAKEKMRAPEYQDLAPSKLSESKLGNAGSRIRMIAGEYEGLRGPVAPRPTEPLLATLQFEDDARLRIRTPPGHTAMLFVHEGALHVGEADTARAVPAGMLAILGPGTLIQLQAREMRSGALLAAGKPLGEPIVQRGPFVMNTEAEIRQAFVDYQEGRLGRD